MLACVHLFIADYSHDRGRSKFALWRRKRRAVP